MEYLGASRWEATTHEDNQKAKARSTESQAWTSGFGAGENCSAFQPTLSRVATWLSTRH
jgi:hypothetical protein